MIASLKRWLKSAPRWQEDAAGASARVDFDAEWYLHAYPDVAAAKLEPLDHYLRFGQYEGRLPRRNRALARDFHLWRGAGPVMLARLERLADDHSASREERHHARWALARWTAWRGQAETALGWLFSDDALIDWPRGPAPALLALECLQRLDADPTLQEAIVSALERDWPGSAEAALARLNRNLAAGMPPARALVPLNACFESYRVSTLTLTEGAAPALDRLVALKRSRDRRRGPLVSVIVPVYNAAETVATAIRSLFAQTWRSLEIIVVDDASHDGTVEVLNRLREECPASMTYTVILQAENRGAYAARNVGLATANGEQITTHDSDDWSHPDRIASQVEALNDAEARARKSRKKRAVTPVAAISHWTRATPALWCHRWRLEDDEGWVHRNLSSLMFRRAVVDRLGFWDEVRVNADSEYLARIEVAYGVEAIVPVAPALPLAFGRASETSLSQHGETHLSSQFLGARGRYMAAARRWHACADGALYLPRTGERGRRHRPFPAPPEFLREPDAAEALVREGEAVDERDRLEASPLFDAGWYLRRHPQLHDTRVEAFDHYWREGRFEGLDPGPDFSQSGYARSLNGAVALENALTHWLVSPVAQRGDPLPVFEGRHVPTEAKATLLLCGHQADVQLYGAERSLLDVARGLCESGYRLIVALPSAVNDEYLETLRTISHAVAILPYGWWQLGGEAEPRTVDHFSHLIERFQVDAVSLNSLVLEAPLIAARRCGVPVGIHLRELPRADAILCDTLNADAETIIAAVRERADLLIANSAYTQAAFIQEASIQSAFTRTTTDVQSESSTTAGPNESAGARLTTVSNTIDMDPLLALPVAGGTTDAPLRVGILASASANKGLTDLEALAAALGEREAAVEFIVFGTPTPALEALADRVTQRACCRVTLAGYITSPAKALTRVQVVLSLAHFEESFGRTALEAMAAGRAFVGYHRGALPEVVGAEAGEGEAGGWLVPFGDTDALAQALATLAADPSRLLALGEAGRRRAVSRYGWDRYVASLDEAYATLLGRRE
ncbi:glycosyltransferase [Salinicola halophilus]|uniref:glycosyltransferase n=1 Tax=Salinicola halophilus TaxID=184065 RepID=UPI000DA24CBD|nr:glycosyltransferase [Salinicola halophilus]